MRTLILIFIAAFIAITSWCLLQKVFRGGREQVSFWFRVYCTLTLLIMFSFLTWEPSNQKRIDENERFETALRMHVYDIYENDTSQLIEFDPNKCNLKKLWGGFLSEVSCYAQDVNGQTISYTHKYSHFMRPYDQYYEFLGNRNSQLIKH